MKLFCKEALISLFMGLILPGILLNGAHLLLPSVSDEQITVTRETLQQWREDDLRMPVLGSDGTVEQMELEQYILGVVLAEMPWFFETEALKAQSVVARTYALKAYSTGGKHGNGSVCTDSGCCQAYMSEDMFLERGGNREQLEKLRNAVNATVGMVLTYEGSLIEATYFSCSGGTTEDAAAVWGTDYPYLRSVSSPGEEGAAYYTDTKCIDRETFCAALDIQPSGAPEGWVEKITYTSGGGVATMVICGREFTGTQLRSALGLRSTAFSISVDSNALVVTTKGYGHRVGMSQYGADAMAVSGKDWTQILAHYYIGTVLRHWKMDGLP